MRAVRGSLRAMAQLARLGPNVTKIDRLQHFAGLQMLPCRVRGDGKMIQRLLANQRPAGRFDGHVQLPHWG